MTTIKVLYETLILLLYLTEGPIVIHGPTSKLTSENIWISIQNLEMVTMEHTEEATVNLSNVTLPVTTSDFAGHHRQTDRHTSFN